MKWSTVYLRVALWFAFCQAVPAGADDRVRDWPSPDHRAKISSTVYKDGVGYDLTLMVARHTPVLLETYDRDVDVYWSNDSRHVAVTDWVVSNYSDCYLVDIDHPKEISLTPLLPKLKENAVNSHFYVSCDGWAGRHKLKIRVAGHTDWAPSYDFEYHFIIDTKNHILVR